MKITKLLKSVFLLLGLSTFSQQQLSLEEALSYSEKHAVDLQKAKLDIDYSDAKRKETISIGTPKVRATLDYLYQINKKDQITSFYTEPFNSPYDQNIAGNILFEQLIFNGSYLVGLQASKVYIQIAQLANEKTGIEYKEIITNAYAGVLVAQENVRILQTHQNLSNKNLHDIKEIYRVGLTEEKNVDQLTYSTTQVNNLLNYAQNQAVNALNSLKYVLGMDLNEQLQLSTTIEDFITNTLVTNEYFNYQEHIDYQISINDLQTKELTLKNYRSEFLPSLAAFANYGFEWYNLPNHQKENKNQDNFIVGLRMKIPFFGETGSTYKIRQAKIRIEQAHLDQFNLKQKLNLILEEKKNNLNTAQDNYRASKELMSLSEKIYEKEKIKFFEGISTSSELHYSETQKIQSQNGYIQSILQLIHAHNAYTKAFGK